MFSFKMDSYPQIMTFGVNRNIYRPKSFWQFDVTLKLLTFQIPMCCLKSYDAKTSTKIDLMLLVYNKQEMSPCINKWLRLSENRILGRGVTNSTARLLSSCYLNTSSTFILISLLYAIQVTHCISIRLVLRNLIHPILYFCLNLHSCSNALVFNLRSNQNPLQFFFLNLFTLNICCFAKFD